MEHLCNRWHIIQGRYKALKVIDIVQGFYNYDVNALPDGIYYVLAAHEDKMWATKFLKHLKRVEKVPQ